MPTALSIDARHATTTNVKSIVNRNSRALITKLQLLRATANRIHNKQSYKYNNIMNAIDRRGAFFYGHNYLKLANFNVI